MKEIELTQDQIAIVDDEDFEELNQFKWCASWSNHTRSFYAVRNIRRENGKLKTLQMARILLNAPKELLVDHINRCTLDNRRQNLRLATHQQNTMNKTAHRDNKLGIKGVRWRRDCKKFTAQIQYNGKQIHLGYFFCLEKAKSAYREAELNYFGEFARRKEIYN